MLNQADQLRTAVKLATRNVMSPGLWLAGLIGLPCVTGAILAKGWIAVWLLTILSILVLVLFSVFVFHSVKNPSLLQSEDFLLKKDAMTIYGSSSYVGPEVALIAQASLESDNKEGNRHG